MNSHYLLSFALAAALCSGCASSGGGAKTPASPAPSVTLPPLGKVAVVPSSYPHRVVVQGQSRSTERREAMTGLDSMLVPMTDLSTDYAAMYAAVIASPVIVGGLLRAATVGALTGISKEELRLAAEFEGQPGNLHRLSGPIATALRAETAAINWLPIEPVTRVLAERSGADSTVEIEIIALWLESRAGGWILRAQASAQVVRLADGKTLHRMSAAFHTPAQRARPLRDWTAVAAPHLQAELKLAVTDLASNLGQQLHAAIAEASRARIQ